MLKKKVVQNKAKIHLSIRSVICLSLSLALSLSLSLNPRNVRPSRRSKTTTCTASTQFPASCTRVLAAASQSACRWRLIEKAEGSVRWFHLSTGRRIQFFVFPPPYLSLSRSLAPRPFFGARRKLINIREYFQKGIDREDQRKRGWWKLSEFVGYYVRFLKNVKRIMCLRSFKWIFEDQS